MIEVLCKLAQQLEDGGFSSTAGAVDVLIRKLSAGPEDKDGESPFGPPEPLQQWQLEPKQKNFFEVGRIHALQEIESHQIEPHDIRGVFVGETHKARETLPEPDPLKSLLAYQKHGAPKGAEISKEEAADYARGYLKEFGISGGEAAGFLAEVASFF